MKTRNFLIIAGILLLSNIVTDNFEKYAYAGCIAPLIGPAGPCFDVFLHFEEPLTQRTIMENYARNIELNYGDWQMVNRDWDDEGTPLQLPAIICTEFVADDTKQYRMAKWVDTHTISSFENHRDDSLCDKWLAPIDDGVKISWDKYGYLPNDVGVVKVIDKEMNQDNKTLDSFDIHVWSDTDHKGIKLTVTETDVDSGIFEGTIFFTPTGKSHDATLLVEDAVYAEHKLSVKKIKIVDETKDTILDESSASDFKDSKNPGECWYKDSDGNFFPCAVDKGSNATEIGMFFAGFWPYVALGIGIVVIFVIWRIRK